MNVVIFSDSYIFFSKGMRYMVVDCGGGTVDITVHEMEKEGLLRELYKATGGAYGGTGKKKCICFFFFSSLSFTA